MGFDLYAFKSSEFGEEFNYLGQSRKRGLQMMGGQWRAALFS